MQANKLTLERHTGRRPGRTHDGVVIALRSNIRWCSDHSELACRNGEIVRVWTVIALLPAWFEDYNEVHPHSGLKFLSPREFLRLSA